MPRIAGVKRKAAGEDDRASLIRRDITHFMSMALLGCNGDVAAVKTLRELAPTRLVQDTPVEDDLPYWKSLACKNNPGKEDEICRSAPSKRSGSLPATPTSPKRPRSTSPKPKRGRPRKEAPSSTPNPPTKSHTPSTIHQSIETGSLPSGRRSSARARNTNVIYNAKIHPQDHALRPAAWEKRTSGSGKSTDDDLSDEEEVSDAGTEESESGSDASNDDVGTPSIRERDSKATRFSVRNSTQKYIDYNRFHHPQDKQLGVGHGPRKSTRAVKTKKAKAAAKTNASPKKYVFSSDSEDNHDALNEEPTTKVKARDSVIVDETDEEQRQDAENEQEHEEDREAAEGEAEGCINITHKNRTGENDDQSSAELSSLTSYPATDDEQPSSQPLQRHAVRTGEDEVMECTGSVNLSDEDALRIYDDVAVILNSAVAEVSTNDSSASKRSSASSFCSVLSGSKAKQDSAIRENFDGVQHEDTYDGDISSEGVEHISDHASFSEDHVRTHDVADQDSTLSEGPDEDEATVAPIKPYESQDYYLPGPNGTYRRFSHIVDADSPSQTVCPASLDKSNSHLQQDLVSEGEPTNSPPTKTARSGLKDREHLSPASRDAGPVLFTTVSQDDSSSPSKY